MNIGIRSVHDLLILSSLFSSGVKICIPGGGATTQSNFQHYTHKGTKLYGARPLKQLPQEGSKKCRTVNNDIIDINIF